MVIRAGGTLFAASLLLAGCVSLFDSKAPDRLISLTAEASAPAGQVRAGLPGQAIVVHDPEAGRVLDVTRVPVRIDDSSIAYLENATWVDRPARLFRAVLAETIRARTGMLVVESGSLDVSRKLALSGRLLDMGYDARDQSVVVRFDALLEDGSGNVRAQRFESVIPGIAPDSSAVAPALNQAANAVAAQVADWVGS